MWLTTNYYLTKTDIWIKFLLYAVLLLGITQTTTGRFFFPLENQILFLTTQFLDLKNYRN